MPDLSAAAKSVGDYCGRLCTLLLEFGMIRWLAGGVAGAWQVLAGFDLGKWRPGLVIIEMNTQPEFLEQVCHSPPSLAMRPLRCKLGG